MILEMQSVGEARALLSAIVSAKFGNSPPYDTDLLTSSLLARIATELSQMIKRDDDKRWGEIGKKNWESWYWLSPERREWRVALSYGSLICADIWQDATLESRASIVTHLVSPFGLKNEMQVRFISELDEQVNKRRGQ